MSLLERQLKAEQAEKTKAAPAPAAEAPVEAAQATAGAPPGSLVPAVIPAAEPVAPVRAAGSRNAAREELLHGIRVRMQAEVINAFDTLLDGTPTDTRTKIEGIVD